MELSPKLTLFPYSGKLSSFWNIPLDKISNRGSRFVHLGFRGTGLEHTIFWSQSEAPNYCSKTSNRTPKYVNNCEPKRYFFRMKNRFGRKKLKNMIFFQPWLKLSSIKNSYSCKIDLNLWNLWENCSTHAETQDEWKGVISGFDWKS